MRDGFVVILEGCDKTGKTTMAHALKEILGFPVVKHSQPKGDPMAEYLATLDNNPGPFIADRYYMGESVYGPIYRDTAPLPYGDVLQLEQRLLDRGALLILMTDSPAAIARRFKALNEDFAREGDIVRLVNGFAAEWRRCSLPKMRLTLGSGLPEMVANAVRYMRNVA